VCLAQRSSEYIAKLILLSYICSIERSVDHLITKQDEQEHKAILNWLTTVNYANQQNDAIVRRQDGTGLWLLNSNEFKQWVTEGEMTLFCPGIPGAGKTIMTSIIVEHLQSRFQSDATTGIAYIYCNFRQQKQQKPQDLLSSLLKQFVQKQPSTLESVKDLYERHKDNQSRPSVGEISKTLHSVVAGFSRAFIIIDALDECQVSDRARDEFVRGLFDLQAKTGANLLVTSRFIPEIIEVFKESVILEIHANDGDLHRYLGGNVSELPSFVRKSPPLQLEIETKIVKAADGM
jgi:Cdc6-like AAA superfamily ATPase